MKKEGVNWFRVLGFGFIIFGIIWSLLSNFSCSSICESCGLIEIKPCYFLFLFVGIIFVVNGFSIITVWGFRSKKKVKR